MSETAATAARTSGDSCFTVDSLIPASCGALLRRGNQSGKGHALRKNQNERQLQWKSRLLILKKTQRKRHLQKKRHSKAEHQTKEQKNNDMMIMKSCYYSNTETHHSSHCLHTELHPSKDQIRDQTTCEVHLTKSTSKHGRQIQTIKR